MHSPSTIPGKRDTGLIANRQENRPVLRLNTFPARTDSGDGGAHTEHRLDSLRKALGLFKGLGIDIIHDRLGTGLVQPHLSSRVQPTLSVKDMTWADGLKIDG